MEQYKNTPFYLSGIEDFPVIACILGDEVGTHRPIFAASLGLTVEEADSIQNLKELFEILREIQDNVGGNLQYFEHEDDSTWVLHLISEEGIIGRVYLGDPREIVIFIQNVQKELNTKFEIPDYLQG